ncbi:hypothetical protein KQ302_10710 [Synechococcus sp. CS-602]|uniref:hypothetical protein n=2 Tax=Synechococcales TaxID=1890424 RepID=UPI0008FF3E63|nr:MULTISPECIES: hypothetical protein [Synechococcaceae]APD49058.1 hypothetical protein BM449_13435 [Synechococcus sp. SynAce01]MCT0201011.1 hypothetical protein [Synechococcus sp. CS-603]MCT0246897.1 hypothetical protein [Synechococcus sp. CS-601]MCT4365802.1 hypothetical protein [Candidatus Regnicoccus frigidus MAG-AL1]TWB91810.1 hypothetical protein FB106_10611 [Synechococcus sp. Ace-Pa]
MARCMALSALALLSVPFLLSPAGAEGLGVGTGSGQSLQQRQFFDDGPAKEKGIIDATNPLELMNMLRRSQGLKDATNPGDAVDRALRELEVQGPAGPQIPGSAGVMAP